MCFINDGDVLALMISDQKLSKDVDQVRFRMYTKSSQA